MRKSKLLILPILAMSLAGCGGGNSSDDDFTYKDGLIDFGEKFNSKYYPVLNDIDQQLSGQITVALVFEGKESGWQAVAKEYQRLHNNSVIVNINNSTDAATYPDKVKSVLQTENPEWNIIQGNLLGGLDKTAYTVSLASEKYSANSYAGSKNWNTVLMSDAFASDNNYILNSENLQTAWFVNTVALKAAAQQGYTKVDASGNPANPQTWDELVSLCEAMQKAGYTKPLGLSLDSSSIATTQFSWLLRVYGDYYYRNEYDVAAEDFGTYHVDLTAQQPENDYTYSVTRLFNIILDGSSKNYAGARSDKFGEFVSQFKKLSPYIINNAYNKSFKDVRNAFASQTSENTKDSPQIMMDYVGSGLGLTNSDFFTADFFDNPKMVSAGGYIAENTLLRDVGGNGGYLSVARHKNNENQDKISMDFLKFFMSPYGQSIYYHVLAKTSLYPQGITLVKNDYVVIPDAWKTYFQSSKVTFTGQSDRNPFITYLVRYMGTSGVKTNQVAPTLWASLLTDSTKRVDEDFQVPWDNALFEDWPSYCSKEGYDEQCYKHPGEKPQGPFEA